jgi:nitroreductase
VTGCCFEENPLRPGKEDAMNSETLTEEVAAKRKANYDISPLLLNRWSPRAMSGDPIPDNELFALFEAARWAPSSNNSQLWRFIVARRQDREKFDRLFRLLVAGNQAWAKDAAALIVIASRTRFEHNDKPAVTHAFDAGSAWENLALEASRRGLVAHGMQGFDYARAKSELHIPDEFEVHAMVAVGRRGNPEKLPEALREREKPNDRRPLSEIVFDGTFGQAIDELSQS